MPIPADQMVLATELLQSRDDVVPIEVREMVKLCHRTEGNSIVMFHFRNSIMRPGHRHEESVAKFTYVQSRNRWRLYWMDSSLKWIGYPNLPEAGSFEELFRKVEADPLCSFWG